MAKPRALKLAQVQGVLQNSNDVDFYIDSENEGISLSSEHSDFGE
jgi:hypothetical protein